MKLLDWMQHKFRQANNDHPTELAPRNSCSCLPGQTPLDDLQYYPRSHYYAKTLSRPQREGQFRKSFTCIETAKQTIAEEEESAAVFSELFHGFLAIGTLAAETVTDEPKTPTFATYDMENETEAAENELKLINDELEKILEPEGKENGCENNENESVVCPLQDYLFSSVIELAETVTVKKEKEHRTSLGELFQKTKVVEVTDGKINKTEKSAVCLMKKILKGRTHNSSTKHSTSDKKPQRKIYQMFHRKVHPEGLAIEPKSENPLKLVSEGNFIEYTHRTQPLSEDIKLVPMVDGSTKGANCAISHVSTEYSVNDSHGSRECWIKSDSEYLVLEL